MNESLHAYMRVGIVHFMAWPTTIKGEGPILETVKRIAADDYFDAIEITWIKDGATRAQVKNMAQCAKLAIGYGAQPRLLTTGMNINDLDEESRRKALATLKEGIDEAYELGASGFAYLSGKYAEATKEASYQALLKSTRELCAYAASRGSMPVNLEVFDYDIDKKSLIGPTELALRFAMDVRREHKNFGLLVDLSHIPMYRESAEAAVLPIRDLIRHVHIGNTVIKDPSQTAYGDTHPRFGFEGGENDVAQVAEFLRVLLFAGVLRKDDPPFLSFEVKPWGDEDAELVIANAKRTLNQAWALV
jgi:sugar phosphate isomerase/epimerase